MVNLANANNLNVSMETIKGIVYKVRETGGHGFAARLIAIYGDLLIFENRSGVRSAVNASRIDYMYPVRHQPAKTEEVV